MATLHDTFDEVYEYWYDRYDYFESFIPTSECSGIREKGWLDEQFEAIDFEASCKVATVTPTISPASVKKVRLNKPRGRIVAITRQRPKDWQYENKPIFAPSWRLLKEYKGGYITYQEFRERYLNEMRHLYRNCKIRFRSPGESGSEIPPLRIKNHKDTKSTKIF